IVDQIGVGVALDHRKPLGDAFVHPLARELDAAAVDVAALAENAQEFAVAAADVEHPGAALHHVGNEQEVDAGAARPARRIGHGEIALEPRQHLYLLPFGRPRALPAESRKPRTMANNSGSSSRNASWPLSVVISANDTRALAALSA